MKIIKKRPIDYKQLKEYIRKLKSEYPHLQVATCGKSELGKQIYALVIGEGRKNILYVGGTHGNEWMTSLMLLRFCEELLGANKGVVGALSDCRLIVIPMLNPDGVDISIHGIRASGVYERENAKHLVDSCAQWCANGRGVDINHNFNAGWYAQRRFEESEGIIGPSFRRYGGKYPESEAETRAVTRLARAVDINRLISFHSQGEEVFWQYGNNTPDVSSYVCSVLCAISGYAPVDNYGHCSGAGLKDWFIEEFGKPAFTVEIGKGKNPLPLSEADEIYKKVKPLMVGGLIV